MSRHRYDPRSLRGDYVRAAAGMLLTAGPLAAVPTLPVVAAILAVLAAVFLLFGLRTALRHLAVIEVSDAGLYRSGSPGSAELPWNAVEDVRLRYYTTRRDGEGGWMNLKVTGAGRAVSIDSSLEGFEAVVARALRAATANGVEIAPGTLLNAEALGLRQVDRR